MPLADAAKVRQWKVFYLYRLVNRGFYVNLHRLDNTYTYFTIIFDYVYFGYCQAIHKDYLQTIYIMTQKNYRYISVDYKLYDITNNKNELIEETSDNKPFVFISGCGTTLEEFESNLIGLEPGASFNFVLPPSKAYGDHLDTRVVDLDKQIFTIDGKFDSTKVYPDAIIPLQNEDGDRFLGHVVSVGNDKVRIDLNHPLAGMTLNFKGKVKESRPATNAEIEQMTRIINGEGGCGGHCNSCGGHCCDDNDGCGNCKNGCHEDHCNK